MGSSASYDVVTAAQVPMEMMADTGLNVMSWPSQAKFEDNACYDYIVVGGGTTGCVVASRLAEDQKDSTLMLEAGGDPPIAVMLAGLFFLLPGSFVDYHYTATRDDYAARGQNNHTKITAGKMLGGSASLNHLLHSRGTKEDYDHWAKVTNDNSWAYENVLPYFIKSERLIDDEINCKYGQFHGTTGPMGITRYQEDDRLTNYLKAFAEVGNPTVLDLNADKNVGYSLAQLTIADGKRQTPAYSYIGPVKDYPNFHCAKNTRATKIIFENKKAVAIEAVNNGKTYTFRAKKEIIISAGAYNTPQLLMLSGIGPREHLKKFNIDVINDLPVGEAMVDQVAVPFVHRLEQHLLPIPNPLHLPVNLTKFPFPFMMGSASPNKSQTCPEYQTYNVLFEHDTPFLVTSCKVAVGLRDEICDRWQKQVASRDALLTIMLLLQPESRGKVCLRSANPFDNPLITMNYYKKDKDLHNMLEFAKDFKSVGNSKYFKKIGAKLVGLDLPECADKKKDSDEFWICYILHHTTCTFHSSSTCPMGKVVDSKLKVIGMENLRIADASVMPMVPRGPLNAAVVMLGEKAADMIKKDHSC